MKKSFARKLFVLILTFCLVFTSAIASFAASAPAKPGKVSITSAKAKSTTQIVLKWKKITKNCKGYQIYRNGKRIKTIKSKQDRDFYRQELKTKYYLQVQNQSLQPG